MKKNVIWWPAVKNPEHNEKYGGYEYFEYSRKTWEYWCKKNDVLFVPFTEPVEKDMTDFRINWQKAIFVFDELERRGIEYDQIALVDSTSMIKFNCPNFFKETGRKFTAWRDMDNLKWCYDSVQGYKEFFDGFELDMTKYINSGFMIFNESHRDFFDSLKKLYYDNKDSFRKLQDEIVRKGNDQTPINYWLQINNIPMKLDLPFFYNLTHIHRKEMFHHNWQLAERFPDDAYYKEPHFHRYGWCWRFNGIPKNQRTEVMSQVWNMYKGEYNE